MTSGVNAIWSRIWRPGMPERTTTQAATAISAITRVAEPAPSSSEFRSAVGIEGSSKTATKLSRLIEANASPELVAGLNAISEQWRGKAPERGFTMALSQDVAGAGRNPDFLLCVALDERGVPGGFLRLVPAYGGPQTGTTFGYTLDLMRHDPGVFDTAERAARLA